jgi:nucleotide-binding universal stress UspA family protein
MTLFEHLLVPIADEEDAVATADALRPYLSDVDRITALHVIQKGGGAVDKAPIGKRREDAKLFLSTVESRLDGEDVAVDLRVAFGTSVAETIRETATDVGATAVAFRPRGGNRFFQWLSGDTAARLVSDPDVSVVSLAAPEREPVSETDRKEAG